MASDFLIPTSDTELREGFPTSNAGNAVTMGFSDDQGGLEQRTCTFIFSIPLYDVETILSAVFQVYLTASSSTPNAQPWVLQRIVRTNFDPSEATWNRYQDVSDWTTAGAGHVGDDITTTGQISGTVPSGISAQWYTLGDIRDLVVDAIEQSIGALRLKLSVTADTGANTTLVDSRDHPVTQESDTRPQLSLTFFDSGAHFLLH